MYARMTTFHLKREDVDKAVDIYENSVVPEAKKQAGFKSAYFLLNKVAGKFVSITFWNEMEDAAESEKSGYFQKQVEKFSAFSIVQPEVEGFAVGVSACSDDN
ncbi:MAG: hypothetical protein GXO87_10430 [Chlorobi bacterium]|nr:hypothetical protein [Chlorobiota bacterium]